MKRETSSTKRATAEEFAALERQAKRLIKKCDVLRLKYRAMRAAGAVPVSADLENCFGPDPADVRLTVLEGVSTGLAGCSIEDYSGDPDDPIYDQISPRAIVQAAREALRPFRRNPSVK